MGDDRQLPRQNRRLRGQSYIRSYAVLTRVTDQADVVLSYVGVTKAV